MKFKFSNKELEVLYTTGKSKKNKIPSNVVDKFFARLQQIEAAHTIYDLWNDKGLNFEKLQGLPNTYSMRLTIKYRLEMQINWENNEETVGEFTITHLSNHYQ